MATYFIESADSYFVIVLLFVGVVKKVAALAGEIQVHVRSNPAGAESRFNLAYREASRYAIFSIRRVSDAGESMQRPMPGNSWAVPRLVDDARDASSCVCVHQAGAKHSKSSGASSKKQLPSVCDAIVPVNEAEQTHLVAGRQPSPIQQNF